MATAAVKKGDYAEATKLFSPVLKDLVEKKIYPDDLLIGELRNLSNSLEIGNCNFEACNIHTTIWNCRSDKTSELDREILPQLAWLHYKLKNYDQACLEYVQLLEFKEVIENPEWCHYLINIYCEKNEQGKLIDLIPFLSKQIESSNLKITSQTFTEIIVLYLGVGLDLECDQLFRTLIKAMQKSNISIAQQRWVLNSITDECQQNNELDFATDLYKFWTDETKRTYGADSEEWFEAISYWLSFCNTYNISGAKSASSDLNPGGAEHALRNKNHSGSVKVGLKFEKAQTELVTTAIKPSTCAQRLAVMHGLQNLLPTEHDLVKRRLDTVLVNMPNSPETAHVYIAAAGLYEQLELPKRNIELQIMALDAIAKWLPKNSVWIIPFMEKLKLNLSANRSVNSLIDQMTTQIESPERAYQPFELCVINSIEMQGRFHDAMEPLKILIAKSSLSRPTKHDITTLWKGYESLEGILERLPAPGRNTAPDMDLVGQFACLLLQPGIQKIADEKPQHNLGSFSFDIRDNKVANLLPLGQTTGSEKEVIDRVITRIALLIPDVRELHFKIFENAATKQVNLSVQRQNGTWETPIYKPLP